jgi:RNA polymerase sigma-70 factor (ECF subfamily)
MAEHGRWLRTVLVARVGDRQVVDDLLQDLAVVVAEKSSSLRDPGKLAPWLYRLAVRAALLHRRRLGRQKRLLARRVERTEWHVDGGYEPDPLEWLLAAERKELVAAALRRLPPRDAEILLLKYTEDWTYRELARRLCLSVPAVEARLHRARERMRKALAAVDPSLAGAARAR